MVIARRFGFSKLVHIESDTYILSPAALRVLEQTNAGWTAFWCPRFNFPESALQIICEDSFAALDAIRETPYVQFRGKRIETHLPFTHIERSVHGNRYGEYRNRVPSYADFAVQVGEHTQFTSQLDRR